MEVFSAAKPGAMLSRTVGTPLQQGCEGVVTGEGRNAGEIFSEKKTTSSEKVYHKDQKVQSS